MQGARTDSGETFAPGCGFLTSEEIERVLDGSLAEDRRAAFERHIEDGCADCVTLAADLELFRVVARDGALETEQREDDLRAEMLRTRLAREARAAAPVEIREKPGPRRALRWLVPAAAIFVIGILGWLFIRDDGGTGGIAVRLPDGEIYVAQAMPFDPPPIIRGEESLDALWKRAGEAYEARQFADAETSLAEIVRQRPASFDARLYRAVCLLALDRVEEARATLGEARDIAADQDLSTASLAWFEGLAALAAGDLAEARTSLEAVASGQGPYADAARNLLASLPSR